ncbi:hypothetical protein Nizo2855_2979 [Lactiplantibacillus plantarum]|nr:hypothetical protein GBLP1_g1069 [Lactiplantibacillus plantarum]KFL92261.1 hypothetical protein LpDm1_0036 [Lactiplantibacillus plantarum]KZU22488.1 hypothetical protein CNW10_0036 [Lactiplantibacillus plantarum]KZU69607.1 hypothetical protein Nizo2855_2979 [Lactiplantibacillus plantarum]
MPISELPVAPAIMAITTHFGKFYENDMQSLHNFDKQTFAN